MSKGAKEMAIDRRKISQCMCKCHGLLKDRQCINIDKENPKQTLGCLSHVIRRNKAEEALCRTTRSTGDLDAFTDITKSVHHLSTASMCPSVVVPGLELEGEEYKTQELKCAYGQCKNCGVEKLIDSIFTPQIKKRLVAVNNNKVLHYERFVDVKKDIKKKDTDGKQLSRNNVQLEMQRVSLEVSHLFYHSKKNIFIAHYPQTLTQFAGIARSNDRRHEKIQLGCL